MSDRGRLRPLPAPEPATGFGKLRVGQWFLLTGVLIAAALAITGLFAVASMKEVSRLRGAVVDVVDPAALRTLEISNALTAQESSARTYGRTNEERSLLAYRAAVTDEAKAMAELERLMPRMPEGDAVRAEVQRIRAVGDAWRRDYAEPLIASVPTYKTETAQRMASVNAERFTEVRQSLDALRAHLNRLHDEGSARLNRGWTALYVALGVIVAVLVLAGIGALLIVRFAVLRPLAELTEQVRAVGQGDFDHRLKVERPSELSELSGHVDAMRRRMLAEWRRASEAQAKLEEQAAELRRSNSELEQFAYVASHDLQEPLRKVASFTQMLDQRYGDQLDTRAKQYIAFAVDGAKRMQLLINDLLDFSRVGRIGGEMTTLDADAPLQAALKNLAAPIEEAGATVTSDELPVVRGNRSQLTQLFQNLIGNAVKFRSEEPPKIHIGVRRDGDVWEFSCTDNGIGIDDKYTERIFLIFQRLHGRDAYAGTGIGLALCKKIVEYHGGRIWVEQPEPGTTGTTFKWTLPDGETHE
ncbi:sensor histidine kinase [Streptosporangium sandarakinum]|uniref:sensor histidine kinase n=1 Tax=Streptosporangium TaxID=2000 RepID=UPI0031F887E7